MNEALFVSPIDRIPPSNLEAEMALLGSILVDREMMPVASVIVQPPDFYGSLHESIFLALSALYERGEPLDKVSLAEELKNRGMLDKIGGMAYLGSLMDTVPTAASAEYYARIVREKAQLRGLIRLGAQVAQLGYDSEGNAPGAVAEAERLTRELRARDDAAEGWVGRTAAEIARDGIAPIAWDIEGLLPAEDGPCFVVGPPASFKTYSALYATKCMVSGEPFAGRFAIPNPRPYGLIVNFDQGGSATERRVNLIGCTAPNIHVLSPAAWDRGEFERLLARFPGAAIMIDCWSDIFHPDPRVEIGEATRTFVRDIRRLCAEYGANGFIVDHSKRQSGGSKATPEFYGSQQKKAASRLMWILEAVADEADPTSAIAKVTCEKMSEAERFSPFSLAFAFSPESVTVSFAGSAGPVKVETSKDRLLAKIEAEGPVTREQLGASGGKTKTDFDGLLRDKLIAKRGKDGRRELYWTPGRIESDPFAGLDLNLVRDETREESDNHAGLSRVDGANPIQPGSPASPSATALRDSESVATGARENEPGSGFLPIGEPYSSTRFAEGGPVSTNGVGSDEWVGPDHACMTVGCQHVGQVRKSDGLCAACVAMTEAPS